jgi:DNA processing protein
LTSVSLLLESLGLLDKGKERAVLPALSDEETAVFGATSAAPLHLDEIALRAHASVHVASAALLTLALENVVVEGPPGFFRRRDRRNR